MTEKPSLVRVLMMPYQNDDDKNPWDIPALPPC